MNDIWVKISGAAGAKVYSLILGVATLALTARLLGPAGRGEVAAVLAWAGLFATLGHMSLGQVAIHQLSLDRGRGRIDELLGSLLVFAGGLTLIGWALAAALYFWPGLGVFGALPGASLALGFVILPFMLWEQYGQSLLMGIDRATHFNRALVLGRTANLVAVYATVGWLAWGTLGAIGSAVLASMVTAAGGFRELLKRAEHRMVPSRQCIVSLARGARRLHLNAIGTYLFSQSGVLVVNHFHGAAATGNYQVSAQLLGVLLILPHAVTQAMYGVVGQRGADAAWPVNRRVLHLALAITLAGSAVLWLIAPQLIALVAGAGFGDAVGYFRAMVPMLLAGTLSAAMAPQWIGRGLFWQASLLTFFVGLCGIGASLLLTPRIGVIGTIYATLLAYGIGAIFNVYLYFYCNRRSALTLAKHENDGAGR